MADLRPWLLATLGEWTGLGSTNAKRLLYAYGYDPDTGAKLRPDGGSDE